MTCIVGLRDGEKVWIGTDSLLSWSKGKLPMPIGCKLFRRDPYLIAGAGNPRDLQLLEHAIWKLDAPDPDPNVTAFALCESVKAALIDNGAATVKSERATCDSDFLIAWGANLYSINGAGGFSYCATRDTYMAAGSGQYYATGSLYSTVGRDPKARVLTALKAAAQHGTNIGPPYHVLHT